MRHAFLFVVLASACSRYTVPSNDDSYKLENDRAVPDKIQQVALLGLIDEVTRFQNSFEGIKKANIDTMALRDDLEYSEFYCPFVGIKTFLIVSKNEGYPYSSIIAFNVATQRAFTLDSFSKSNSTIESEIDLVFVNHLMNEYALKKNVNNDSVFKFWVALRFQTLELRVKNKGISNFFFERKSVYVEVGKCDRYLFEYKIDNNLTAKYTLLEKCENNVKI